MIITQRTANLSYSTDPVAAGLRTVLAAPAAALAPRAESATRGAAPLNLGALYPNLFAAERQPIFWVSPVRAAAFRLSLVATAAAIVSVIHH